MTRDAPIHELLVETRAFPPPAELAATSNVDPDAWRRAASDPVAFWADAARRLRWETPFTRTLDWTPPLGPDGEPRPPRAEWFADGTLNVAVNCVDRHVEAGLGDKVAYHWEGEPGDRRTLTFAELQEEVARAANALTELGIRSGDRVVIYLPVLLETVIATLAVARIGAVHSLVFGGFSAEALRFRVADTGAKLLITSDGQFRRGAAVPVKQNADDAVAGLAHVEHVLVVRRTGDDIPWTDGRDVWWHELVDRQPATHEAEAFPAETPLFIIYTSGTTGKPKGLVHTSGGYLTQAAWTHWAAFDAKPDDVHWCTADLAWVTAHTYELYGPLANATTQVIYEGTPDAPRRTRHFEIIERYGVTVYYTAPTLVRTLMTWFPDGAPADHDLSSIRLLGSVGEAINPEAWMWFREHLGAGRAPIIDTWWQSETGAAVMAPIPGLSTIKPGSATRALPGLRTLVVDEQGAEVPAGAGGYLVIPDPWPALARTVWGDPQRYLDSYWRRFAELGYFFSGDGAKVDADGDVWLLGRVDDVINVSGHRLSTIEIESALVAHPLVGEAGVTGADDAVTGEAIVAFVIPARETGPDTIVELRNHVARVIGPIAKPREIHLVPELPKTRSGKIMRRLLRDIVDGRPLGDTTSLQDPEGPGRIAQLVRG
ncbi:acetate--CoA ligase [Homoserinibacter sp. GY 40078]|uniref:acetate--CoA ligase n=1 Tax=Homoserinibacter sp. GY 40078 TaxID=2603275 RepID=UPI0011C9D727|nr:acetate--CoA ligase [Homoserinibacter sp. GY 40078]TXK18998.1 acetate--CoA ligase [Homoserinibacter sp. GY 40078]